MSHAYRRIQNKPKHSKKMGAALLHSFYKYRLPLIIVLVAALLHTSFGIAVVSGSSMTPALYPGDVILFWRLSGSYQSGDILLIKTEGRKDYIKRVSATPGEIVEINEGVLLVNGRIRSETYVFEATSAKPQVKYPLELAKDEYFVMGDHRSDSRDSRNYGAIGLEQIDGKVLIIIRGGV